MFLTYTFQNTPTRLAQPESLRNGARFTIFRTIVGKIATELQITGRAFTKYLDRKGFGVWLVGAADQPHPKISFAAACGGSQAEAFTKQRVCESPEITGRPY